MKRSHLAAAVLLSMAGGLMPASGVTQTKAPPPMATLRADKQLRQIGFSGAIARRGLRQGPGWTQTHVQRMAKKAKKAKNVRRNRMAHR